MICKQCECYSCKKGFTCIEGCTKCKYYGRVILMDCNDKVQAEGIKTSEYELLEGQYQQLKELATKIYIQNKIFKASFEDLLALTNTGDTIASDYLRKMADGTLTEAEKIFLNDQPDTTKSQT